jgi:hypothetical protein
LFLDRLEHASRRLTRYPQGQKRRRVVLADVMSRTPTPTSRPTRVSVLGGNGASYEMFDIVSYEGETLVVKGPLLFEVGETLRLKLERDGNVSELRVRVAAHAGTGLGDDGDVMTEIRVVDSQPVKRLVSG